MKIVKLSTTILFVLWMKKEKSKSFPARNRAGKSAEGYRSGTDQKIYMITDSALRKRMVEVCLRFRTNTSS